MAHSLLVLALYKLQVIGKINRHDVVVYAFADQKFMVQNDTSDGDFKDGGAQDTEINIARRRR